MSGRTAVYWSRQLKGDLVAPDLPLDYPRPDRPSMKGASYKFRIPQQLSGQLRDLGKSLGATPFVVLLTIFKTLLYRYTGQNLIGTTTSEPGGGRRIVVFVNTGGTYRSVGIDDLPLPGASNSGR
jgi:hypothetical protein